MLESIEQDQTVGASLVQSICKRDEIGEVRTQLDCNGYRSGSLDGPEPINKFVLDDLTGQARVGRNEVHVQLERISAGRFDQTRELRPSTAGDAIQAADD